MKVVYAQSALANMGWFRRCYAPVFPQGQGRARDSLLRTEALIAENPYVGHPAVPDLDAREFPILRTPFSILYRVTADRIEILRILDQHRGS